eukprot:CAMPEP_0181295504 /NCGR_PEP_ID=MMETSP1101-20121128/4186_1 /TAXON_ID=46948 /ORGANISM="Rhodomonas abbreviata, Strain Caron Lab Isolate" /LENGTH=281 /DNA_ID=CAMNT_0023400267 /DNA_START=88 /DNA_END=933 /DNA_ORIENTATION=-
MTQIRLSCLVLLALVAISSADQCSESVALTCHENAYCEDEVCFCQEGYIDDSAGADGTSCVDKGSLDVDDLGAGETITGNFEVRGNSLVLVSCPVGYLLINSSLDEQQCRECPPRTYSFDPLDGCKKDGNLLSCPKRDCAECAVGAHCFGGSHFVPSVEASTWELEVDKESGQSVMRLVGCAKGYVLVRDSRRPTFDQCFLCPFGTYSLQAAVYPHTMVTDRAEVAETLCLPCASACVEGASCADCPGGAVIEYKTEESAASSVFPSVLAILFAFASLVVM